MSGRLGARIWVGFLTVLGILATPMLVAEQGWALGLAIGAAAAAFPWLLYFVIGVVLERAVSDEVQRRLHETHPDSPPAARR